MKIILQGLFLSRTTDGRYAESRLEWEEASSGQMDRGNPGNLEDTV